MDLYFDELDDRLWPYPNVTNMPGDRDIGIRFNTKGDHPWKALARIGTLGRQPPAINVYGQSITLRVLGKQLQGFPAGCEVIWDAIRAQKWLLDQRLHDRWRSTYIRDLYEQISPAEIVSPVLDVDIVGLVQNSGAMKIVTLEKIVDTGTRPDSLVMEMGQKYKALREKAKGYTLSDYYQVINRAIRHRTARAKVQQELFGRWQTWWVYDNHNSCPRRYPYAISGISTISGGLQTAQLSSFLPSPLSLPHTVPLPRLSPAIRDILPELIMR